MHFTKIVNFSHVQRTLRDEVNNNSYSTSSEMYIYVMSITKMPVEFPVMTSSHVVVPESRSFLHLTKIVNFRYVQSTLRDKIKH